MDREQQTGSKSGKKYITAAYCHCAYLTYMQSTSCEMLDWMTHFKIVRRTIRSFRYADNTTLMAESEEELKSLLMEVKEESENADLKLNIQKTKITASGPITSWQIDGETMETETLFWGAPKSLQMVTAAMKLNSLDCSLEEKLWPT